MTIDYMPNLSIPTTPFSSFVSLLHFKTTEIWNLCLEAIQDGGRGGHRLQDDGQFQVLQTLAWSTSTFAPKTSTSDV